MSLDETPPPPSKWHDTFLRITQKGWLVSVLAMVLAVLAGGILIAVTDEGVQTASGYFFQRPGDTFAAIGESVGGAYAAFFRGAVFNPGAPTFARAIRPLTETLTFATPLIAAGLGVALAFRIGMFNIGGRGQMLMAAAGAGWVAGSLQLPWGVHMVVAVLAGIAAAALWAGIAGLLKATTGAHEVIVTIMLNYIAIYLLLFMLRRPGLLQAPGQSNPTSAAAQSTAVFPELLGPQFNLHFGLVLVILATLLVWWIIERSALGFKFRAVGENPNAARVAGIDVKRMYVYGMVISGALIGLAGASQVLGTITTGFTVDIDAGIGFDAITVALLGRSTPWGTFAAGILFGAFKAGGFSMQAAAQVPVEIVVVVQALIVLFIAAPPLVRAIFFLPSPERDRRRAERAHEKALKAKADAELQAVTK
ncbi:ABC transporter permease [Microbacterium sp.]|uniref:ABC transporter permease n=1 Tax=Microbacterium sp. TaxID=51671 RepID=UPI0039E34324